MEQAIETMLPGGVWRHGRLVRQAVFRPLTGLLEQRIGEMGTARVNRPCQVTAVLEVALDTVGGETLDQETVASLCVADRQFLMLRLAELLEGDELWLSPVCTKCDMSFDVGVGRSSLPIKEAGAGFPLTSVRLRDEEVRVRSPTGADQEAIAELDDEQAMAGLLNACMVSVGNEAPSADFIAALSDADIQVIDEALDGVSPSVGTRLSTVCPECGSTQLIDIDPYAIDAVSTEELYEQVHEIAYHYHWSESEILSLPRERRQRYLHYIDRARGMHR